MDPPIVDSVLIFCKDNANVHTMYRAESDTCSDGDEAKTDKNKVITIPYLTTGLSHFDIYMFESHLKQNVSKVNSVKSLRKLLVACTVSVVLTLCLYTTSSSIYFSISKTNFLIDRKFSFFEWIPFHCTKTVTLLQAFLLRKLSIFVLFDEIYIVFIQETNNLCIHNKFQWLPWN